MEKKENKIEKKMEKQEKFYKIVSVINLAFRVLVLLFVVIAGFFSFVNGINFYLFQKESSLLYILPLILSVVCAIFARKRPIFILLESILDCVIIAALLFHFSGILLTLIFAVESQQGLSLGIGADLISYLIYIIVPDIIFDSCAITAMFARVGRKKQIKENY